MKYACIEKHRGEFTVTLMCRVLEVTRTGYYAWRERRPCVRAQQDTRLRAAIQALFREYRRRYGSPRLFRALREAGVRTSRKRVARLMREAELRARARRRFVRTTDSEHSEAIAPNLLERRFAVGAPDQAWVADITYVPTAEGWLFLAIVLDVGSRRIVGWNTGSTLDATLTLTALQRALNWRRPVPGLIHHSDRGLQYAAAAYRALLARHGMRASMSRVGNCWDNALAESFFATLEWELIDGASWPTRAAAHRDIAEYIEIWYNRVRMHSSLGDISPALYESRFQKRSEAA